MWPLLSVDFSWHINISTHTSRVGCDTTATPVEVSTMYFYSHIPCGMWQIAEAVNDEPVNFYSHIPCGMWPINYEERLNALEFLLTHPVWDVTTKSLFPMYCCSHFYSHIPCGMWLRQTVLQPRHLHFYSHIPCGMWPLQTRVVLTGLIFLLTHPVWDVTEKSLCIVVT